MIKHKQKRTGKTVIVDCQQEAVITALKNDVAEILQKLSLMATTHADFRDDIKEMYRKAELMNVANAEAKKEFDAIHKKLDNGIATSLNTIVHALNGNGKPGLITQAELNRSNINSLWRAAMWFIGIFGTILSAIIIAAIIAAATHIVG